MKGVRRRVKQLESFRMPSVSGAHPVAKTARISEKTGQHRPNY
jgi:hypothetical protein